MHDFLFLCLDDFAPRGPTFLGRRVGREELARVLADAAWTRGLWLQLLGRAEEAIEPLEHARDRRDDPIERAAIAVDLLPSYLAVGRLKEAVATAEHARRVLSSASVPVAEAYATAMLGLVERERRRPRAAQAALERALALYERAEVQREVAVVCGYLGELALERDRRAEAKAWLERAASTARAIAVPDVSAWIATALAAAADDLDDAVVRLLEAAGAIEESGDRLRALVELRYGHVDLLKATAAPGTAGSLVARAERRVRAVSGTRDAALGAAARILSRAIDARRWSARPGLRVGPDVAWVVAPNGTRLALARRPVLRRVVDALVTQRTSAPGDGLDVHALFAAAWPGEKALADAAANRVYVAVARLRKLGLGDCLRTGRSGFYLDPDVPVLQDASVTCKTG